MTKKDKASYSAGGITAMELLGVVFITLKLCGVINWSWWLVTLPLWGPVALVLLVILFVLVGAGIVWAFEVISSCARSK